MRRLFLTLRAAVRVAHNEWALREIHPAHPDVPALVLETLWWREELGRAFS